MKTKEPKLHAEGKKTPANKVPAEITKPWKITVPLGLIILISLLSYLPVFQNTLLGWDDKDYLMNNPLVSNFNLVDIFSQVVMGNYHPVTILVYALQYHLFGFNPTGYHAVNLLLHLVNVVLVFYTILLLSDKAGVALITALLFGVHPLHVESVAWAAELKDLLYTLFFLASYIYYLRFIQERQRKFYVLALVLFFISLLSKAMAASLPVLILLTDYFKGRKITKETLIEKAPFFILSIIFGIIAVIAQRSSHAYIDAPNYLLFSRIVFATHGFVLYLFKLLLPLNLCAFYPYPTNGIPTYYNAFVLIFSALLIYTFYSLRFSKKIFFGMGFFTITVFLVLQLLPVGKAMMADRYSYIPSIGVFYLAGEGLLYLWNRKYKWPVIALLSVAVLFFSTKTFARCGVWKNDIIFWNDVIEQYPEFAKAYYSRGVYDMDEKRNEDALKDFNKAIELDPMYAEAYYNRGICYMSQLEYEAALKDFNKSIELVPDFANAYNNRGIVFSNKNKYAEAVRDFNKVIELEPHNTNAYTNRGFIFMNEKRNSEAFNDFNKAIELNPGNADSYYSRGLLFVNENRYSEALHDFNKAIELKPDFAEAYISRGNFLMKEKRNSEAINDFNTAIHLNPENPKAYLNRGLIFANESKDNEALNDFNKAIELKPDYAAAYLNKANIFLKIKKYEEAISIYSKAIDLKPDYAQAYFNKGYAEFYSGRKTAACMDFKKAESLGFQPAVNALAQNCK